MEINTTVASIIVNDANDIKVQTMDNWAYKAGNNLRYRIDVKRSIYTNYQFQWVGIRLEINLFPICVGHRRVLLTLVLFRNCTKSADLAL